MGAWGAGLYSNDDASDLVELLKAVLKLPMEIDELIELMKREMLEDGDEIELTFWLVLADQLEKKGLRHEATTAKAISILENQTDIDELRNLDMAESDLVTRVKYNEKMLARLRSPRPEKLRKTLNAPQASVVAANDLLTFPTQNGKSRNPYFPVGKEMFEADGWGLAQVHEVGHEFGYLNWISIFTLSWPNTHMPSFDEAVLSPITGPLCYGTLSKSHFKKMEIVSLGNADQRSDAPLFEKGHTARSAALSDVSISNAFLWLS
ncbi:hypothetical protein SAMN05444414_103284 [Roseovarius marisflavi]|uniref:DUF4259 domain-containing protein n=1 Tax=Roseovarius marisflavi TaxID=1054996 RepID=A0A1M6X4A9_9RHOB|nr:hypothetical protein [Roseovarius marisflavi]SHL00746.1 hypothetical protein SAMN05444414_103284 [Roseovarius marisflavi]